MQKETLYGKTLDEIIAVTKRLGMPGFSAMQIADWLYKKEIATIDEMSNLSKKMRTMLSAEYEMGLSSPEASQESSDGTKKYLYKVLDGKYIETAYIPGKTHSTICLSSQSGCKMGCKFCMTGKQGFQGSLSSGEILNQLRSLPEFRMVTNIVYMGMGEPLDNIEQVLKSTEIMTSEWGYGWSPSRITVSTVGLIKTLREFLEKSKCHLAVSLHSPFDEERRNLMPVQETNSLADILRIIKDFHLSRQRRISFEYILFKGLNDTPAHVRELTRILNGIRCRINIIRFHSFPGSPFVSPGDNEIEEFKNALNKKGILTTVRASRGMDIQAACGLLSTMTQNKS